MPQVGATGTTQTSVSSSQGTKTSGSPGPGIDTQGNYTRRQWCIDLLHYHQH